ncbi:hypothetical protein ACQ0MK_18685 [Thalassospira lucentensis]|uniref:hypothetical protein n=1 Tax=Thalassospira lucentensis TaxID=168935 RepID=UPI003D2EBC2E
MFIIFSHKTYVLLIRLKRRQTDEFTRASSEKAFNAAYLAGDVACLVPVWGIWSVGLRVWHVNSLVIERNTTLLIAGKNPYKPAGD